MDKLLIELEQHLEAMKTEHEALYDMVCRKREALRASQIELVRDCCERENIHIQRIGAIEKRRQDLIGRITVMVTPDATELMRLSEIVKLASPSQRERLTLIHNELRQCVIRVRDENSVMQRATKGMLQHVQGIMQMIGQVFGDGGTYSRCGKFAQSGVGVSSFTTTG